MTCRKDFSDSHGTEGVYDFPPATIQVSRSTGDRVWNHFQLLVIVVPVTDHGQNSVLSVCVRHLFNVFNGGKQEPFFCVSCFSKGSSKHWEVLFFIMQTHPQDSECSNVQQHHQAAVELPSISSHICSQGWRQHCLPIVVIFSKEHLCLVAPLKTRGD